MTFIAVISEKVFLLFWVTSASHDLSNLVCLIISKILFVYKFSDKELQANLRLMAQRSIVRVNVLWKLCLLPKPMPSFNPILMYVLTNY